VAEELSRLGVNLQPDEVQDPKGGKPVVVTVRGRDAGSLKEKLFVEDGLST
jgi:hypothetical protein